MTTPIGTAAAAYLNAARTGAATGMEARDQGSGFADMLREAVGSSIETVRAGEAATVRSAAGKADLMEVVQAVNNAELTVQTVVAVRDRIVQSYQEIMRMPI
jgi:flagellar hook-basal body complex protein FliE